MLVLVGNLAVIVPQLVILDQLPTMYGVSQILATSLSACVLYFQYLI